MKNDTKTDTLARLRELAQRATPGPWFWAAKNINGKWRYFALAAPHGGTTIVMDFARSGMNEAEPRFGLCDDGLARGKRGGILYKANELMVDGKLNHPDANLIEMCDPQTILRLLDVIAAADAIRKEHPWLTMFNKYDAVRAALDKP